jgi:hypothetical protein
MAIDEYVGKVYAVERHTKELREERERCGAPLPLEIIGPSSLAQHKQ